MGIRKLFLLSIALILSCFSFSQNIFQPTDVPASPLNNDGQAMEFGVKFRAATNGYITGIRFYKGLGTAGTHIGQLWSNEGSLLGSAIFANETASGWQQVLFSTPVSITAGITYVAACHSDSGYYAFTNPYFTQPVVNGPLRALANGEDGPNGVFKFSSIPIFPNNNFQSINYWVDVVFSTTTGPDIQPPLISSISPAGNASGINPNTHLTAVFNEAMNATTINGSTFELRSASNILIPATVTYSPATNTAKLTPASALSQSSTYTAKIKGGPQGAKDTAGNALQNDFTWFFTTSDQPFILPTEGYGGPILVISNAGNPFSRYAVEILRAEGLSEFAARDISNVTAADLNNYDVIILGEMGVTADQVSMFNNWVHAGGVLIAFKPDDLLTPLMGISTASGLLNDKYLLVNTASGAGAGIVSETIQFHGGANLHTLNGATSIATLYNSAIIATENPAVTLMNVGTNGGKAVAFTYDLAKSIIYTRQGNPAWAGQERDGQSPVRSDDMFFGLPTNSGNDWVDFNKIAIPQADEQQRLLANIIIQSNLHRKPLPRLWYLPRGLKAAVVMTGDDHANNGTAGRFNNYLSLGPNTTEAIADWYAVRGTSYIYPNTPITNAEATSLQAQGFEIALHPSTGCTNYTPASLENVMTTQLASLASAFPGISAPVTNRTHCLVWSDWATHAKVQANHGIRLDVNYYYWPGAWVQNRPGMFTGSGMPMRFADTDGTLIDCYQVTTQMTDESGIDYGSFSDQLLDKAIGPEGYYGTFCANMHTDSANHIGSTTIINSAIARKIPVISSKQMLTWLDGRNNSYFDSITWSNNQLHFRLTAPSGARNLNGMLPRYVGTAQLNSITMAGISVLYKTEIIKGIEYVFFHVAVGSNRYIADYNLKPIVVLHPVSQTICTGNPVSFQSEATGTPAPSVQWQHSENGINWVNISRANNNVLSFTPVLPDNNKQYRAVWTNNAGSVNSNPAILTVKQTPSLSSTLTPAGIISGTVFSYTPTSATDGTSFNWSRAAISGISNPAATGTGAINETLINTTDIAITVTYVYKLAANECFNTQYVNVKVEPLQQPGGCRFSTSITAKFNGIGIPAGRHIWFNSIFNPGSLGSGPVNFFISNSKITYILNNQVITLNVPDAHILVASNIASASTRFINDTWKTEVPLNYDGNVFMTGLAYLVPKNLPGNIKVTWTADIESDKENVTLAWKWTAGVYTNFAGHPGLNVKPIDGLLNVLNPLLGLASAGTPQNYVLNIVAGAMGAGLLNITSTYSMIKEETCRTTDPVNSAGLLSRQASPKQVEKIITALPLHVNVMPNPAHSYFNIIISSNKEEPVTIRVLNMFGQVIEKHGSVNAQGALRIGHGWKGGTYFAEVIQGDQRKIVKIIKLN